MYLEREKGEEIEMNQSLQAVPRIGPRGRQCSRVLARNELPETKIRPFQTWSTEKAEE